MSVDDSCEDAGQIGVWLDAVQFAGFNERREHGPVLRPGVVACEERLDNRAPAFLGHNQFGLPKKRTHLLTESQLLSHV